MFKAIRYFWTRSIQRQMMLGITLVHAVLMTIFVTDLVHRQKDFLHNQSLNQTLGLSQTLAASSASWVLSDDVIGLEEVIESHALIPDLEYAMIVSPEGRILGHTDRTKVGLYLSDGISQSLLAGEIEPRHLVVNNSLIDISAPITSNDKLVGWARVGISQNSISQGLAIITRDGLWYTLLAILVGSLFAALMARGITLGLNHLVRVTKKIQKGESHPRSSLDRPDELGTLGHNFNAMIDVLESQKEQISVTLRSLSEGVITTDIEGRVSLLNPRGASLIGMPESDALGRQISEIIHIETMSDNVNENHPLESNEWGQGKYIKPGEFMLTVSGNRKIPMALSGAPLFDANRLVVGSVLVFRDVTEEREVREQSINMRKLESLGVLAGGIAHDFNNILTGILGNIDLAKLEITPESNVHQLLKSAEQATYRAKGLTEQLLTFAKGGNPVRTTVLVSKMVHEVVNFNLSGSSVKCTFHIPDDLSNAQVDEGQISQVLQNTVINAVQAMPDGGSLFVECKELTLTMESQLPLDPGAYIRIAITDTGHGIAADELTHIFDPYYSTKRSGSGLGLAISHSILVKHGGHMEAKSTPGKGTTLYLYLPLAVTGSEVAIPQTAYYPDGSGTIVIMDDEEIIRRLVHNMLTDSGYSVIGVTDGKSALELLQQSEAKGPKIELFIMDLTIPGGLGGKDTIAQMLELYPDTKAIVSSGYGNDTVLANFADYGFQGFVKKPYTKAELLQAVNQALNNQ